MATSILTSWRLVAFLFLSIHRNITCTRKIIVRQEGDRIALMRKSNGELHYYINGLDQGIAAKNAPDPAWGVVDLYGMAVKVTIIEHNDAGGAAGAAASASSPRLSSTQVLNCLLDNFQERLNRQSYRLFSYKYMCTK